MRRPHQQLLLHKRVTPGLSSGQVFPAAQPRPDHSPAYSETSSGFDSCGTPRRHARAGTGGQLLQVRAPAGRHLSPRSTDAIQRDTESRGNNECYQQLSLAPGQQRPAVHAAVLVETYHAQRPRPKRGKATPELLEIQMQVGKREYDAL